VVEPFKIESANAGPFVTVLTIVGAMEDGAHESLRAELENPELSSRSVIVDLTEAVLYDSWPFPLLSDETERLGENGGRLVVVSGDNPTVKPFVGDASLPGLRWFESLDDAMVELLGDLASLGDWPPDGSDDEQRGATRRN
jgi:anti-anti-sigma regulatory factor